MGSIVQDAMYGFVSKFFLIFVVAPAGIILGANLIYILAEIVRELCGRRR